MPKRFTKRGFTLIELVIAMVIGAIIIVPTSFVVVESLRHTFLPEHLTVAAALLEGRIEWVSNLRFSEVTNVPSTNFSGAFSDYSYRVSFYYVDSGDLNTESASATDYKRVEVRVTRAGFPDVTAVTLVTNN